MNSFPAFLLGVFMILTANHLSAQNRDSTIQYFFDKIENQDSIRFYGKKLFEYTINKPEFTEDHLSSSIFLCDISLEKFNAPSNRPFFQSIYNIVTSDFPLSVNPKINGLRILGDYYHSMYDIDQSLKYYHHALSIVDTTSSEVDDTYLSVLYTNISDIYLDLNEFKKARLFIEKAIELDIKTDGPVSEFLGLDYNNLARTYRQEAPEKSIIYFLKAKNQLHQIKLREENLTVPHEFEDLYVLVADNYLALKNHKQALLEIDTAITMTKSKTGKSGLIHGKALEMKAVILQDTRAYSEALKQHRLANEFLKNKITSIAYRPQILLEMARCYLAMDQPEIAYQQIEIAFRLIDQSGSLNQSRLDKIIFPKNLFQLYYQQAQILTAQYQSSQNVDFLYQAQDAYKEALNIFEAIKHTVSDQDSRQIFMKNNTDFFESAIDLNFQIWKQQNDSTALHKILLLSEKSKNNILYESLNKSNTSITSALPDTILQQIQYLDIQVSQTEKKIFQAQLANQKAEITTARDQLIKYREEQKIQMEYIEKKYPQFYQLKYHIAVPTISELQKKLLPDEGVISYYVGVNHLYVIIVDQWNFSVERIPMDFSLFENLDAFNQSILSSTGKTAAAKKALQNYHETGFLLYQKLIAPFVRKLPARLTILPDNVLENLSFDALLTELPLPETPYQNYPFLLNKYTISYQYTAHAVCRPPVDKKNYTHHFIAFAPSFSDERPFSISQLRDFGQLTHNVKEVEMIKNIIGHGTVLKNTAATEDNFMKLAPDYQIIHLATHGKVNTQHSDYSYLAFQEVEDSIENELLYIKDIYGLQLNANMVVLSACETANGALAKGEGIVNLARGFTYAGASSVVPTLWKISDVATAKLMEKFYLELKAGQPKHIAMATAKRHFIETSSTYTGHPFYWAAFVLVGDVSPIHLATPSGKFNTTSLRWWGTGILFFLFLVGLLKYFRNRTQANH